MEGILFKYQKWADDEWDSQEGSILKYDKLEHFILGFVGYLITRFFLDLHWNILLWEVIGTGWEIKDSFVTRFSPKDLAADNYGFFFAEIVYQVIERIKYV